jgi:hypothetical protein
LSEVTTLSLMGARLGVVAQADGVRRSWRWHGHEVGRVGAIGKAAFADVVRLIAKRHGVDGRLPVRRIQSDRFTGARELEIDVQIGSGGAVLILFAIGPDEKESARRITLAVGRTW